MDKLDRDIADAFQVISLLLVFVLAYFSAIYGQVERVLREQAGASQSIDRLKDLRGEHRTYRRLLVVFVIVVGILIALIAPPAWRVTAALLLHGTYSITRAGLLIVEIFLISTLAVAVWLIRRLTRGITKIADQIDKQTRRSRQI